MNREGPGAWPRTTSFIIIGARRGVALKLDDNAKGA